MKTLYNKLFCVLAIMALMTGCREEYSLQVGFDAPTALIAPLNNQLINIDLEDDIPTIFEWEKANAHYAGVVLYEIAIDKADGDFSNPLVKSVSNSGGADNWFSLTPKQLIALAKAAGIGVNAEGEIKWKVTASQGGERKDVPEIRTLKLHRPDGISEIPEDLYIFGQGFEAQDIESAFKCRKMEDGVFEIFGSMASGELKLCNATTGNIVYYRLNDNNKLIESDNGTGIPVNGTGKAYRITLDFNLLTVKMTEIREVKMVRTWEYTLATFTYAGNHKFTANNAHVTFYYDWGWEEERYRFWVTTDKGQERWGSFITDDGWGSNVPGLAGFGNRPDGGQPAYYYNVYNLADLNTTGQSADWTGMYKLPTATKDKNVNVVLDMSPGGDYTHSITILP